MKERQRGRREFSESDMLFFFFLLSYNTTCSSNVKTTHKWVRRWGLILCLFKKDVQCSFWETVSLKRNSEESSANHTVIVLVAQKSVSTETLILCTIHCTFFFVACVFRLKNPGVNGFGSAPPTMLCVHLRSNTSLSSGNELDFIKKLFKNHMKYCFLSTPSYLPFE